MKKLALKVSTAFGVFASYVTAAFAGSNPSGLISNITSTTVGGGDLLSFTTTTLSFVIGIAALIAVGFLIFSGIKYITSNGDEQKVADATKGITYAIIGLIICFISVLIVRFVLQKVLVV